METIKFQAGFFRNPKKNNYISPEIQEIYIDNQISLQLQSNPPLGPGEQGFQAPFDNFAF